MVRCQSSSLTARNPSVRGVTAPTLFTRMSRPPKSRRAGDELGRTRRRRRGRRCRPAPPGVRQLDQLTVDRAGPGDHLGTLGDECLGDGKADALARAGDDGDFVFQVQVHQWPRSCGTTARADAAGLPSFPHPRR